MSQAALPPRRRAADGATVITAYLVLLFTIPSRLVVGPLGSVGSPATIVALTGLAWWAWTRLANTTPTPWTVRPVRRAAFLFSLALGLSFIASMMRPIADNEFQSTQSGLIMVSAWLGLLLLAHDGIPNRDRFDALIRTLALCAGILAFLGILQFLTGNPLTNLIQIPGLHADANLVSINERAGFRRPAGTAIHPIEFGATLTLLLPLCIHVAFHPGPIGRIRRWFPIVAVAIVLPFGLSRSAMVTTAIVAALLVPTWPRRARFIAALVLPILIAAIFVSVPGLLGTILQLFTGVKGDSSTQSRTGSYELAFAMIDRSPWVGRGFLTFLPQYRILDNQYLGMLIDTGTIGVVSLLALFAAGALSARQIRKRTTDAETRSLAQSFVASISAAAVSFALFDAFSFPMFTGLTFLILGMAGRLRSGPAVPNSP